MVTSRCFFYVVLRAFICMTIPFLGGCSAVGDYYDSFASKKPSSVTLKTEQIEDFAEIRNEIKRYHSEYESMRPALVRLVNLENDLAYVLDQMNEVKVEPIYTSASELPVSLNELDTDATDKNAAFEALKALSNDNNVQKPIVGSASPVLQNAANRVDSKFSGEAEKRNVEQLNSEAIESIDKKFKGLNNDIYVHSDTNSNPLPCDAFDINQGGKYAIHIASYVDINKVRVGWDRFKADAKQLVCNKQALVAQVKVKEKVFHSLRFGPFRTKQEATSKCGLVKNIQSYCGVTVYEGDVL